MQGSPNAERIRTKRRFCQFSRTASTLDLRLDRKLARRKRQAERYEQRHGRQATCVYCRGQQRHCSC